MRVDSLEMLQTLFETWRKEKRDDHERIPDVLMAQARKAVATRYRCASHHSDHGRGRVATMMQIPANAVIFVLHDPVSFRAGINGTSAIVRTLLEKEPMSGAFFVYRNKLGHMLRILIQTKNRVASGYPHASVRGSSIVDALEYLQIVALVGVLTILVPPLARYMARVYQGAPPGYTRPPTLPRAWHLPGHRSRTRS